MKQFAKMYYPDIEKRTMQFIIERLLKRAGIINVLQKELAKTIGVRSGYISQIKNLRDPRKLTIKKLLKVMEVLHCPKKQIQLAEKRLTILNSKRPIRAQFTALGVDHFSVECFLNPGEESSPGIVMLIVTRIEVELSQHAICIGIDCEKQTVRYFFGESMKKMREQATVAAVLNYLNVNESQRLSFFFCITQCLEEEIWKVLLDLPSLEIDPGRLFTIQNYKINLITKADEIYHLHLSSLGEIKA